jgi:hypothetical protein
VLTGVVSYRPVSTRLWAIRGHEAARAALQIVAEVRHQSTHRCRPAGAVRGTITVPDVGHTVGVKRGTAIRHLVEMAEVATEQLRLSRTPIGWPLTEMWVAGALLESSDEIDHGTVVLMIDLPPDELPWLAAHPTAEWVGEQLRLGRRPMLWSYRPAAWPAWTYRDQRVARFWSASNGIENDLIDELRSGVISGLVEPDRAELVERVGVELEVSKAHLRSILAQYWDYDWRRNNRSHTSPEDQLWRAATAVTELEEALTEFGR